jgi:hypothetical protein
MITPLNRFIITSSFMKIIILILLGYTLYLNYKQITILNNTDKSKFTSEIQSQLNLNIMCSYMFCSFVIILFFFIIKSFF